MEEAGERPPFLLLLPPCPSEAGVVGGVDRVEGVGVDGLVAWLRLETTAGWIGWLIVGCLVACLRKEKGRRDWWVAWPPVDSRRRLTATDAGAVAPAFHEPLVPRQHVDARAAAPAAAVSLVRGGEEAAVACRRREDTSQVSQGRDAVVVCRKHTSQESVRREEAMMGQCSLTDIWT